MYAQVVGCVESSGQRIVDAAECRLRSNSYLALRNISCEGDSGILILRGYVPTYYLKQVAQEVVAEVDGVDEIVNEIEVTMASPAAVCASAR